MKKKKTVPKTLKGDPGNPIKPPLRRQDAPPDPEEGSGGPGTTGDPGSGPDQGSGGGGGH